MNLRSTSSLLTLRSFVAVVTKAFRSRRLRRRSSEVHLASHRQGPTWRTRAKVVHVNVGEPIVPIEIEDRYQQVALILHGRQAVLGHVYIPAPVSGMLSAAEQWTAITHELGNLIWQDRLRSAIEAVGVAGTPAAPVDQPPVSVVVCTRDRPEQLRTCLSALVALRSPPAEIVVVDNDPSDDRTSDLCGGFPVRYVREPLPGQARARNRGIVESTGAFLAFTDDDCVVDSSWLDDLASSFKDPLVMAVTGYIGPLELEEPSQFIFETHYGFGRSSERRCLTLLAPGPSVRRHLLEPAQT